MPNLREKFKQFVQTLPKRVGETPEDVIADFWLSALTSELEGVREVIKSKKIPKEGITDGRIIERYESCNDGLDTALAIITTSLEGIKK